MCWTPVSIESGLDRMASTLSDLGLSTPFSRARGLVACEEHWDDEAIQWRWQSRMDYWQEVLLGGEGAAPVFDLEPHLEDLDLRRCLFETAAWGLYDEEGVFSFERAEGLLQGRLRQLDLEPVQIDPSTDYDWMVQHPRDALFQHSHQNAWHFMYLALAHFHRPDPAWVEAWVRQVAALVDQCPRLPDGHNDYDASSIADRPSNVAWGHYGYVATRLRYLVLSYALMADHPAISPGAHGVIQLAISSHARHLHELGPEAYKDNLLTSAGKALYLTASLMPWLQGSGSWLESMWPPLCEGMRRELLDDGTHVHRSLSYHLTFVERPLSMVTLARKLGRLGELPGPFLSLVQQGAEAFVKACTPIRSTPGINDDWTVALERHDVLRLLLEAFDREDWRFLATDGREGTAPGERSTCLPHAGLAAMRSDWSRDARYLFFNASPDAGHHHPDPLSIQVWSGGRRLLVDPGVGHYYTGEREIARRSWWHNCPTLGASPIPDDADPKVLTWRTSADLDLAVAEVRFTPPEGSEPVRFRRHVAFVDRASWVIWDTFEGLPKGSKIWENLHFIDPSAHASDDGRQIHTGIPGDPNLAAYIAQPDWRLVRDEAWIWLSYGAQGTPTGLIHLEADAETASEGFASLLVPFCGRTPPPDTGIDAVTKQPDGSVTVEFRIDGERRRVAMTG